MSRELLWLTLTVGLTALIWVPYILDRIMVRGLMGAMANPIQERQAAIAVGHADDVCPRQRGREPGGLRAAGADHRRAQHPQRHHGVRLRAVLLVAVAHLVIYTAGWPIGRTLAFTGGFIAQVLLLIEIFRGVYS